MILMDINSSVDYLVTVRVIYDMARLQRDYLVPMLNDMMGCYDRTRPAMNTVISKNRPAKECSSVPCKDSEINKSLHQDWIWSFYRVFTVGRKI